MTGTEQPRQRFVEIVKKLGPGFAARAREHDQKGSFVAENYAQLKEHRVFSALIPAELGGGGASYTELCQALRELGAYCGSTGLALSMHSHLVAAAVWRHRHGQPAEALLRRVAQGELVLVSTGAGDWVDSVGQSSRVAGGYRVSARKRFGSGSPAGDLIMTSVPYDDPEQGAQVLHFAVPIRAEGVRVLDDWDTLGMRGTGSHTIELNEVFVPDDAISLRRPRGVWHPSWNVVVTVAIPIFMAPYFGIAERAATLAREAARKRPYEPLLAQSLGELENALAIGTMAFRELVENANELAFEPVIERGNAALIRKTIATNAFLSTVKIAVEIVGGGALFRANELERLTRDIAGVPFHPLPEKRQLAFSGRVALGLPPIDPSPSAR